MPRTNPSKTALSHSLFVMPTSICTIRFHIRTILFAFRRVRVCVCFLVSHPCETMGTHAKASLPCLPLPLHRTFPFPQPLQKDNTPSPRTTTLASLVKGRWIGGKAQTLTLLHLLAICSPFLYCKLFCRQDGGIATPPTLPRTNPSKTALSHSNIHLPTDISAIVVMIH